MRRHSPTAAWVPEAISAFEVEYSDVRRMSRIRGRRRGRTRLLRLEGYFSRNRFEFDFYTKGLEGKLVALVGRPLGLPFLALGLSSHLISAEERWMYPATHGSSCTGDMVWCVADHLRRPDLMPRYDQVPSAREMVHASAIYGLENLTWRTLGPVERRLILGEVVCYSKGGTRREDWFDVPEPSGLIVYPVLVLRMGDPRREDLEACVRSRRE